MPLNHNSKSAQLTDEQFILIGKLTIEFSNLEYLLGEVLSRLLITPSFLAKTYTERMNVNTIIEKIKNALDLHNRRYNYTIITKVQCHSINIVISEIDKIRLIRNKFAHYCWFRSSDKQIFGTSFSGKQAKLGNKKKDSIILTNHEIKTNYEKAHVLVIRINEILLELPELLEDQNLKTKLTGNGSK